MARKPKTSSSRPSFFKVLIKDDYTKKLRVPNAFVQKYGEFLPENAKLKTSSGETWDVKLHEETDDDDGGDEKYYCFTDGWKRFAKDLELKLGEFLVFWFNIGKSTSFDVSVFGVDGCEREISAKSILALDIDDADEDFEFKNTDHCRNVPDEDKQSTGADSETNPRFEVVLTNSRKSRVCLYKDFAEAAGLIGKRAVVLEYPPKHRYWPVLLDRRPCPYASLQLAIGWHDFRIENGLMFGKTYSFEFNPTKNVIQVKEEEKKRSSTVTVSPLKF